MNIKILSLVSVLAWCAAAKASQDGSKVLVTMDGKPLITQQQLDQAFDLDLNEDSSLRESFEANPNIAKDNFLDDIVKQEVINKYIHDNKIDTSPIYQKALKHNIDVAKFSVNVRYLTKYASEAELQKLSMSTMAVVDKYISDNKIDTLPGYQQELKHTIDTMKSLNNNFYFDQHFKYSPLDISDAEVQKFYSENKQNIPELRDYTGDFENIKEGLRGYLHLIRRKNEFNSEIERLKKEYKIVVVK